MTWLFGIFSADNQNFRSLALQDSNVSCIFCDNSPQVRYNIHILQSILVLLSFLCPCLRLRVYNYTGIPTRLQGEFEDFFTRGRGEAARAPTMQVPPTPAQITQPVSQGFLIEVPPGGCHITIMIIIFFFFFIFIFIFMFIMFIEYYWRSTSFDIVNTYKYNRIVIIEKGTMFRFSIMLCFKMNCRCVCWPQVECEESHGWFHFYYHRATKWGSRTVSPAENAWHCEWWIPAKKRKVQPVVSSMTLIHSRIL